MKGIQIRPIGYKKAKLGGVVMTTESYCIRVILGWLLLGEKIPGHIRNCILIQ